MVRGRIMHGAHRIGPWYSSLAEGQLAGGAVTCPTAAPPFGPSLRPPALSPHPARLLPAHVDQAGQGWVASAAGLHLEGADGAGLHDLLSPLAHSRHRGELGDGDLLDHRLEPVQGREAVAHLRRAKRCGSGFSDDGDGARGPKPSTQLKDRPPPQPPVASRQSPTLPNPQGYS